MCHAARMARPTSRSELLERMAVEYERLHLEVAALDPGRRERPGACDDWSVKDLLAHLDAWHEMFLGWESEGRAGRDRAAT